MLRGLLSSLSIRFRDRQSRLPAVRRRRRRGFAAHQAKSCSGPLRPSGLSPENSCASLPLGHRSRPRLGSHFTRCRRRFATARIPLTPSTITRRPSSIVAPARAILAPGRLRASFSIHSAPARVFPNPRPASISQVRQPAFLGGSCDLWAHPSKSQSCERRSANVML